MFEMKVGIEVEFFVTNNDKIVMPAACIPKDDFPLMGEIRAEPGETVEEVMGNTTKELVKIIKLLKNKQMLISGTERIPLSLYRKASKACVQPKNTIVSSAKNIYGTDISNYSDQIIKNGKIQGIFASCGLHIHFSCRKIDERTYEKEVYSPIQIPLKTSDSNSAELIRSSLDLYKRDGYSDKKTISVNASLLNKPTIEWMVKKLDDKFFERFMKEERKTKYRQPGFFELKPYGFEYRSLPATKKILDNLQEIVEFSFELLEDAKTWV
jgi:hypothetical protein